MNNPVVISCLSCCGLWLLMILAAGIWLAYLNHKGELVADAPVLVEIERMLEKQQQLKGYCTSETCGYSTVFPTIGDNCPVCRRARK